jgi:uncharacterized delta-60 repeat protein
MVITDADYDPNLTAHYSVVKDLAVQSDGKIIAVGLAGPIWDDFAVARYNTAGTLDALNFNSGGTLPGVVNTSFYLNKSGRGAQANAVAIDSNGQIVVAGGANDGFAHWYFALARYNSSDGSLDATFNSLGKLPGTAMTQIAATADDDQAYAIAIQTDKKIVVAGYSNNGVNRIIAVARYNSDGSLDSGFGSNGIFTKTVGAGNSVANSIAIQNDGNIVVGGTSVSGTANVFTVMRLLGTNGSLDTSFGTGGIVTTAIGTSDDEATAVAIDSSGRIVTTGFTYTGSIYEFALVRYNTDGSLDTSFGTGGKVTQQIDTSPRSMAYAITLQGDGKIVAGGYSEDLTGSYDYFTLVRYWP